MKKPTKAEILAALAHHDLTDFGKKESVSFVRLGLNTVAELDEAYAELRANGEEHLHLKSQGGAA